MKHQVTCATDLGGSSSHPSLLDPWWHRSRCRQQGQRCWCTLQ